MAAADLHLSWSNHHSALISVFNTLLESKTLVDCTLAAEGQYLKAHKVFLSACSPYLETLLNQHYEKHPIVILKDVGFSELKSLMDFMYRGEVSISRDKLGTFLKTAESLQIKGLFDNEDDAREMGLTGLKKDALAPSDTQTCTSEKLKRSAPVDDSNASTSRSSPSLLRKRRRSKRPSQGDDPDSDVDTNACNLANVNARTTPLTDPSIVPTNLPKHTEEESTNVSKIYGIKEITESFIKPEFEHLDYKSNRNLIDVEDIMIDDDNNLDASMDTSRAGSQHRFMSNEDFQSEVMAKLNAITDVITGISIKIHDLQTKFDEYMEMKKTEYMEKNVDVQEVSFFPLKTTEEVDEFEKHCKEDPEFFNFCVLTLKRIGGTNTLDTTVRILRKTLTNEVAEKYSLLGRKKKKPFQGLQLYKLIQKTVRVQINEATVKEIDVFIARWLVQATLRIKRAEESRLCTQNVLHRENSQMSNEDSGPYTLVGLSLENSHLSNEDSDFSDGLL